MFSYLNLDMFHVELYGELFLGDGLQMSDVSDTFFLALTIQLYHSYDCVLLVAQEVCGM
jgi:hypothetical protein